VGRNGGSWNMLGHKRGAKKNYLWRTGKKDPQERREGSRRASTSWEGGKRGGSKKKQGLERG